MNIETLLRAYPIISDQIQPDELQVLLFELEKILASNIKGAIVEFGCYSGTSSLFIQRLLALKRQLHVYDSFEGLPEKSAQDQSPAGEQFKTGELCVSKAEFVRNFKKAGLPLPIIRKGWFDQLTAADIPKPIAFAFLDGDYYKSIRTSLRLIESNLTPGSVIVVDDYANEALPGAAKAVDEWLVGKPYKLRVQASLAIITIV